MASDCYLRLVRAGGVVVIAPADAAVDMSDPAGTRVAWFVGDAADPEDRAAAEAMADELFGPVS